MASSKQAKITNYGSYKPRPGVLKQYDGSRQLSTLRPIGDVMKSLDTSPEVDELDEKLKSEIQSCASIDVPPVLPDKLHMTTLDAMERVRSNSHAAEQLVEHRFQRLAQEFEEARKREATQKKELELLRAELEHEKQNPADRQSAHTLRLAEVEKQKDLAIQELKERATAAEEKNIKLQAEADSLSKALAAKRDQLEDALRSKENLQNELQKNAKKETSAVSLVDKEAFAKLNEQLLQYKVNGERSQEFGEKFVSYIDKQLQDAKKKIETLEVEVKMEREARIEAMLQANSESHRARSVEQAKNELHEATKRGDETISRLNGEIDRLRIKSDKLSDKNNEISSDLFKKARDVAILSENKKDLADQLSFAKAQHEIVSEQKEEISRSLSDAYAEHRAAKIMYDQDAESFRWFVSRVFEELELVEDEADGIDLTRALDAVRGAIEKLAKEVQDKHEYSKGILYALGVWKSAFRKIILDWTSIAESSELNEEDKHVLAKRMLDNLKKCPVEVGIGLADIPIGTGIDEAMEIWQIARDNQRRGGGSAS